MSESPNDRVLMVHQDLAADPQEVSRRQFDRVWKDRGWILHDPAAPASAKGRKTTPDPAAAAATPKEN